jgi:hypothetical protein
MVETKMNISFTHIMFTFKSQSLSDSLHHILSLSRLVGWMFRME